MKFGNRSPEKKDNKRLDIYIKALFFGVLFSFVFIGGGKLFIFIIKTMLEYWIWIVALIGVVLIGKRFLGRKKQERQKLNQYDYNDKTKM